MRRCLFFGPAVASMGAMNVRRIFSALVCSTSVVALSACGMFGSKVERPVAATGPQEFDPYSNTWTTATRVVTPPPSQPNATLAEQQAQAKRDDSMMNKASRAMSNTASSVSRAVKKPLGWLPFGKKYEGEVEKVQPEIVPPKTTMQ
jgi:hypothetical protein